MRTVTALARRSAQAFAAATAVGAVVAACSGDLYDFDPCHAYVHALCTKQNQCDSSIDVSNCEAQGQAQRVCPTGTVNNTNFNFSVTTPKIDSHCLDDVSNLPCPLPQGMNVMSCNFTVTPVVIPSTAAGSGSTSASGASSGSHASSGKSGSGASSGTFGSAGTFGSTAGTASGSVGPSGSVSTSGFFGSGASSGTGQAMSPEGGAEPPVEAGGSVLNAAVAIAKGQTVTSLAAGPTLNEGVAWTTQTQVWNWNTNTNQAEGTTGFRLGPTGVTYDGTNNRFEWSEGATMYGVAPSTGFALGSPTSIGTSYDGSTVTGLASINGLVFYSTKSGHLYWQGMTTPTATATALLGPVPALGDGALYYASQGPGGFGNWQYEELTSPTPTARGSAIGAPPTKLAGISNTQLVARLSTSAISFVPLLHGTAVTCTDIAAFDASSFLCIDAATPGQILRVSLPTGSGTPIQTGTTAQLIAGNGTDVYWADSNGIVWHLVP